MAADLHIHIYEGLTEDHLRRFFGDTIGSKYFRPTTAEDLAKGVHQEFDSEIFEIMGSVPGIWVGEVSWLKAALLDDTGAYVPLTIETIDDLIGEDLPEIDNDLIVKVKQAMELKNQTGYRLADPKDIVKFLEKHKGKRAFTISW